MKQRTDLKSAVWFLAPNAAGFLVFLAGPLLVSLLMAFTNWDLRKTIELRFIGLRNFTDLLASNDFWLYLINTLYLMLGIPLSIAGSLVLALLLSKPIHEHSWRARFVHGGLVLICAAIIGAAVRSIGTPASVIFAGLILLAGCIYCLAVFTGVVVYRTLYYLPNFTAGVALYILWKSLYNPQTGAIDGVIRWMASALHLGRLEPPQWLASVKNLLGLSPDRPAISRGNFGIGAREALILMGIVTTVGGANMLLYLAGLSNIPQELYEAADIDGASAWQRFWNVTWPQLAPTTFFIIVMSCIGGLQGGFDVAKVMTNGGPANTTVTLSFYIYQKAFLDLRLGYASAISWVLFLVVLAVTAVNWKFGNRELND